MMRIVDQQLAQIPLEAASRDLGAQRIEQLPVAEPFRRIAAVHPGFQSRLKERKPARIGAGVLLARQEFALVQHGLDVLVVKPLARQLLKRLAHDAAAFRRLLLRRVADLEKRGRLLDALRADLDILAEPLLQKRLLERRLVRAGQHLRQDGERHLPLTLVEPPDHPAVHEDVLLRGVPFDLIRHRGLVRRRLLDRDLRTHLHPVIVLQEAVKPRQHGGHIHLAVEKDAGVGGMVVARMERLVRLERQIGDVRRIAAGFVGVAVVREEKLHRLPERDGVRIRECPLHLRIDHAVQGETVLLVELVVPALLIERHPVLDGERMQHGVHVHVHQVEEVSVVARGDGIDGLVRIGHRVQEGRQRTLQEFDERLLDGVLLRAAEDGMLQDVRHARAVLRHGLERDRKGLVLVVALQPREFGAVLLVGHAPEASGHLGKFGDGLDGEVVDCVVWFHCVGCCGARKSRERGDMV